MQVQTARAHRLYCSFPLPPDGTLREFRSAPVRAPQGPPKTYCRNNGKYHNSPKFYSGVPAPLSTFLFLWLQRFPVLRFPFLKLPNLPWSYSLYLILPLVHSFRNFSDDSQFSAFTARILLCFQFARSVSSDELNLLFFSANAYG